MYRKEQPIAIENTHKSLCMKGNIKNISLEKWTDKKQKIDNRKCNRPKDARDTKKKYGVDWLICACAQNEVGKPPKNI